MMTEMQCKRLTGEAEAEEVEMVEADSEVVI